MGNNPNAGKMALMAQVLQNTLSTMFKHRKADKIRVMTFNTWNTAQRSENSVALLAKFIIEAEASIVLLQVRGTDTQEKCCKRCFRDFASNVAQFAAGSHERSAIQTAMHAPPQLPRRVSEVVFVDSWWDFVSYGAEVRLLCSQATASFGARQCSGKWSTVRVETLWRDKDQRSR